MRNRAGMTSELPQFTFSSLPNVLSTNLKEDEKLHRMATNCPGPELNPSLLIHSYAGLLSYQTGNTKDRWIDNMPAKYFGLILHHLYAISDSDNNV